MNIILASQSPRRRELLGLMGLTFTVHAAHIDEHLLPDEIPQEAVARLCREKALAIAAGPDDVVIAADTIVVCDGKILGKPQDKADAFRMLSMLSGRDHDVMTGFTVRKGNSCISHVEITHLTFRPLSDAEIHAYIETGEPMDKAGAYGIQGKASMFVSRLTGDYFNVVGLPVCSLTQVLRSLGVPILGE